MLGRGQKVRFKVKATKISLSLQDCVCHGGAEDTVGDEGIEVPINA
jgi:hypothetical protein